MREPISLECTECGNRNYHYTKNKRVKTERLELRKYCRYCRRHTIHREVKKK